MLISQGFANFAKEIDYNSLPDEVVATTRERILDTLGAAIAGYSNWDYSRQFLQACRCLGHGENGVIGCKMKIFSPAQVAMINSTYAHAIELDDGHKNAGCHAGAVVVPTALAVGQQLDCSGKDIIAAVAAGYEIVYRIASHANPPQINKGFHPSSNCGVFGAAVTAGKLMGLTAEQLANGIGQAGMFASGTMEATVSGLSSKCVQVGKAAYNGIFAASIAQSGMECCITALDGNYGLFQIQSEDVNLDSICRELGEHFSIGDTYSKLYPTCRHAQPGIEAVLDLAEEQEISPYDVERIEIGTHKVAYQLTGIIKAPRNPGEAKFSLAYGAAVALRERSFGVIHLTEPYYSDSETLALAARIECRIDSEIQAMFPAKRGAKITITLKNGRIFERKLYDLKGSPDKPVTWSDLEKKFRANCMGSLPQVNVDHIVETIKNLEQVEQIKTLVALLA